MVIEEVDERIFFVFGLQVFSVVAIRVTFVPTAVLQPGPPPAAQKHDVYPPLTCSRHDTMHSLWSPALVMLMRELLPPGKNRRYKKDCVFSRVGEKFGSKLYPALRKTPQRIPWTSNSRSPFLCRRGPNGCSVENWHRIINHCVHCFPAIWFVVPLGTNPVFSLTCYFSDNTSQRCDGILSSWCYRWSRHFA